MIDTIGIIGFLILLYTAYLIVTEGSNKKDTDSNGADNSATVEQNKSTQQKQRKSAPATKIESEDDGDVLRQGKGYTEQSSADTPNVTPQSEQHFESEQQPTQDIQEQAPSTKNREEQPAQEQETVSVTCPYCDTKVLVPKGGNAECPCCSSVLNDNGGIVD
ncbi:MAG: hypothetical protein NC131_16430 [Roseburia sp.]|nr:hypothetical protein [Roseburia sp.]